MYGEEKPREIQSTYLPGVNTDKTTVRNLTRERASRGSAPMPSAPCEGVTPQPSPALPEDYSGTLMSTDQQAFSTAPS